METFFLVLGFFLWLALSERLWFFSRTPLLIISAENGYVNPLKIVSMTTFWVSNSLISPLIDGFWGGCNFWKCCHGNISGFMKRVEARSIGRIRLLKNVSAETFLDFMKGVKQEISRGYDFWKCCHGNISGF
jgi:hypothetical protein